MSDREEQIAEELEKLRGLLTQHPDIPARRENYGTGAPCTSMIRGAIEELEHKSSMLQIMASQLTDDIEEQAKACGRQLAFNWATGFRGFNVPPAHAYESPSPSEFIVEEMSK